MCSQPLWFKIHSLVCLYVLVIFKNSYSLNNLFFRFISNSCILLFHFFFPFIILNISWNKWNLKCVKSLHRAEPCTAVEWRATSKKWKNLTQILWVNSSMAFWERIHEVFVIVSFTIASSFFTLINIWHMIEIQKIITKLIKLFIEFYCRSILPRIRSFLIQI